MRSGSGLGSPRPILSGSVNGDAPSSSSRPNDTPTPIDFVEKCSRSRYARVMQCPSSSSSSSTMND